MPQMNYNALRGRIRECGLTQKEVAARIGVSEGQLNRKLAGEFAFRQDEMESILKLLEQVDGLFCELLDSRRNFV